MHPSSNSPSSAAPPTTAWYLVFAAWLLAAASSLGALFFGEVMQLPTCNLCWYQRIFMFPLALILPFGLFPFDRKVIRYGLALAIPGLLIAMFHQLLVAGMVPTDLKPCRQGVPCSETVITWFGFLTIPLLSIAAFIVLVTLLYAAHLRSK